ncbi:hypothetical protein [Stenotrophomonas sp.]|uniref:hypothetical protein n=1 Tax=Stenotrophomonas sp. TaxID=69392 RepID=UPI002FC7D8E6
MTPPQPQPRPSLRLRRAALVLMSATTVFGLAGWAMLATAPGCTLAQGRWSGAGVCHTRLCLLQGDCGERAAPVAGCAHVQPGDSRGKVYFHLGNPLPGAGALARWPLHKSSAGMIQARFDGDRLVSLACPAAP